MTKPTEKELTELEKKVLQAQEKLAGINDAINRDQLIAEKKAKDILVLEKLEKQRQKQIEQTKQICSEVEASLISAREKSIAEKSDMVSRKAKIQAEIDALWKKIWEETEKLSEIATAQEDKKKKLVKEFVQLQVENNKKWEKLQNDMKEEENKQRNFKNETIIAEAKLNWILEQIKSKNKELEQTNKVLADLIAKKLEIENLQH